MKVHLLSPRIDVDRAAALPANAAGLIEDLGLETLFSAMAAGDVFLFGVARHTLLTSFAVDWETIRFRQAVLEDCLANADTIRQIYALAVEAEERRRRDYFAFGSTHADAILSGSVRLLESFCDVLRRLRTQCAIAAPRFSSDGLRRFCRMLEAELTDDYLAAVTLELRHLHMREGALLAAKLGRAGKATHRTLREPTRRDRSLFWRLVTPPPESYPLYIHPQDDAGWQALSELRNQGVALVADALRRSADHVSAFFSQLRHELGFYVASLNLAQRLDGRQQTAFPTEAEGLCGRGLSDAGLALTLDGSVTGNDFDARRRPLIVVTGANRGGKSTFLRSVGLAQLMTQAGMFVAAESFSTALCDGLFTHFAREEDASMTSGKFDDELRRMSAIADGLGPRSLVLFNESFAGTNEREGAEVASQIVLSLFESGVRLVFVTHMYEFAHRIGKALPEDVLFLRAGRGEDGQRSFRLVEGEPLRTGFAGDLYNTILAGVLP